MSQVLPIIKQDTDTAINLILKDSDGNRIDLNSLSGLIVVVFQDNIEFDQFSYISQTGFKDIVVTDAANGEFTVNLDASKIASGVIGKRVYYEIKTQSTNTNFENSNEWKSTGRIELAVLAESQAVGKTFS